jgi:hypothetical protein
MAENKTKATDASVEDFLNSIPDENKRKDAFQVLEIMKNITKEKPTMWGSGMVGFGNYHYKYASGREGDIFLTGFSPRKQDLTIYINGGFEPHKELMEQLGKYKTGKVCLYIKKLEDIKLPVLKKLIKASVTTIKKKYQ